MTERLNEPIDGDLIDPPSREVEIRPGPGPFSPEERAQVVRWIEEGHSRNEIVRRTGRGNATITRIAQAHGLTFKRSDTMTAALEAGYIDKRAKRLALAEKLLTAAHRLTDQLFAPTQLIQLNNRTGEFVKLRIKEPTPQMKRDLMTSIGIATDKIADLERLDAPQEGKQAIIALVDTLRIQVTREQLGESHDD